MYIIAQLKNYAQGHYLSLSEAIDPQTSATLHASHTQLPCNKPQLKDFNQVSYNVSH